jgi:hypothetical protein
MSINRSIRTDRAKTKEKIIDRSKYPDSDGRNWLGHETASGAAKVDELLMDGESKDKLITIDLGYTKYRAYPNHKQHLREAHGLKVVRDTEGKYLFDRADLGMQHAHTDPHITSKSQESYLPNKEDFERAYRSLSRLGQEVSIDAILDKIESDATHSGLILKENWRMITERNIIDVWSKK